ncbi:MULTISPECIES: hypothetical protein [unclassified Aurantimonas]|uniref:hypothetical protein n=1 Tax=unclassified Aurantimonas TaxID=2638230 RepID=UPI002E1778C9
MERARTIFGVRFTGGNHHLVETLSLHLQDAIVDVRHTPLWRHHETFRPASTNEALSLSSSVETEFPLFTYPWGTFRKHEVRSSKDTRTSRFCGPSSESSILEEFKSTCALYTQLRESGYNPYRYPNSFIGGTWLESLSGEREFVVLQGNHRVSCLASLGHASFEVRPLRGHHWIIRERDVERWAWVRQGWTSTNEALQVFRCFFQER